MNFPVGARVLLSVAGSPSVSATVVIVTGPTLGLEFAGVARYFVDGRARLVVDGTLAVRRGPRGAWYELATGTPVDITLDPRPDPEVSHDHDR